MTQFLKSYIKIIGFILFVFLIVVVGALFLLPSYVIEICNIVALILGPVLGVYLVKQHDKDEQIKQRRWEIFRTLILTWKDPLSREFVTAFNLIQIEFYGKSDVMQAWNELFIAFDKPPVRDGSKNYVEDLQKYNEGLDSLLSQLISAVAKCLDLDSLKLHEGGYKPKGLEISENDENIRSQLMTQVLMGNQSISVSIR